MQQSEATVTGAAVGGRREGAAAVLVVPHMTVGGRSEGAAVLVVSHMTVGGRRVQQLCLWCLTLLWEAGGWVQQLYLWCHTELITPSMGHQYGIWRPVT